MAQSTSSSTGLFSPFESNLAPLDEHDKYIKIIGIEKDLADYTRGVFHHADVLEHVADKTLFPNELISNVKAAPKPKMDPLKRLKEMSTEEVDEEEETADEEEEDEETAVVEDEEDDAGGDYLVSHFDNGENFEDNDDEGDDMTSML